MVDSDGCLRWLGRTTYTSAKIHEVPSPSMMLTLHLALILRREKIKIGKRKKEKGKRKKEKGKIESRRMGLARMEKI